jgi:precorrin-2/cobalt-factor-2 C20-methyltransferase
VKLYCVGCGPGDPDLLTIKAIKLIESAQTIFAPTARDGRPSAALNIAKKYLKNSTKTISLIFPMIKDKESLKECWKRNTQEIVDSVKSGKRVVYLTVGDPALYSTWIYIHRELIRHYKHIEVEIVPGIASMCAFAAKTKMSLVEGDETLGIVPACYDLERVKKTANSCDTVIFLKDGRYFDSVIEMLHESGFEGDSTIAVAQDLWAEEEIMKVTKLSELKRTKGTTQKYFSIMVAKKKNDTK